MKTTITFRQMPASQAIKDFVNEKLEKADRFAMKSAEAHVILSVEKFTHIAEVVVTAKGVRASAKASSEDMYQSIDQVAAKVLKTLKKHHDKKVDQSHHNAPRVESP